MGGRAALVGTTRRESSATLYYGLMHCVLLSLVKTLTVARS
jgi:hypothetical protein